jgi:site-specific recombinase XerD
MRPIDASGRVAHPSFARLPSVSVRLEDLLASFRRHLRAAGRHAISAWLAENPQPSTVATRLRGMRRFCRWLLVEGELDKAPTEGIEIAVAPDKPVPILSDAEITALLKTCAVGRGRPGTFARPIFLGRRDEVILRLLLDTGVRVSELCGLKLEDVDLDREVAHVIGKGSRPRAVPFGARTGQAIDRYLRVRALHARASSPKLLLRLRGAMTVDEIREVLEVRSRHAGVDGVHPHRFRHTSRTAGWAADRSGT